MIIKSKSNTIYWIPVLSSLAGLVIIVAIVFAFILGDPEKVFQLKPIAFMLGFLALSLWMPLSEFRKISNNGDELLVDGVFKKRRYLIGEAVIAVTSMGRRKSVGLHEPYKSEKEIIDGIVTIKGAVKVAKKLGEYFAIPYGETKSFQQLQEYLNR